MLEYVDAAQQRVLSDLEARQGQLEVTIAAIDELAKSAALPDKERDTLFMLAPPHKEARGEGPLKDRKRSAPQICAHGQGEGASEDSRERRVASQSSLGGSDIFLRFARRRRSDPEPTRAPAPLGGA